MKALFSKGDKKYYSKRIEKSDVAAFASGTVHEVYATFAIARDAEWSSRLFAIEMKDDDEEGIGTMLEIKHLAPAFPGETIDYTAEIIQLNRNELICKFHAKVGERLVAEGKTGQKILKKAKLNTIFQSIKTEN